MYAHDKLGYFDSKCRISTISKLAGMSGIYYLNANDSQSADGEGDRRACFTEMWLHGRCVSGLEEKRLEETILRFLPSHRSIGRLHQRTVLRDPLTCSGRTDSNIKKALDFAPLRWTKRLGEWLGIDMAN